MGRLTDKTESINRTSGMVRLERHEGVLILRLEGKAGTFGLDQVKQLSQALDEVERAQSPSSLVILGSGKFFSAGFEMKQVMGPQASALVQGFWRQLARLLVLPIPTIAAINGHAFGSGAFIALACDFRLMVDGEAKFCFPEVALGIPLGVGFAELAKAKLSPQAMSFLALSGHKASASEALKLGIIDKVFQDTSQLEHAAKSKATSLATSCKPSLGLIKKELFGPAHTALNNAVLNLSKL